ncbi:MAG TPA: M48 family metallopeptidase, partial [Gemmata sp.]|nr:M48 family metallopeptidase [Gemmata sp.]
MSAQKIPYPPSPTDVPEGLTDYPASYVKQENRLLAGLFVFLIFYLAAVVFFAMVGTWCVLTLAKWPLVKIVGLVLSTVFFLFLVKGFFKRHPMDKDTYVEIHEDDHPVLFGFIQTLCDEIEAPFPNKVYVSADVNAACIRRLSLINLFVEPKRDLLIGLGLVNCMNLSEFKAVLAHEFGHFCQSGQTRGYTNVVQGIIGDMVRGEDWFDRLLKWCKKSPTHRGGQNDIRVLFRGFATVVSWILDGGRWVLLWIYKMFALQDRAMSREREFHADKVAVSAAGSDASTHGLLRARFGMQCFIQAIDDLVIPARDNKQYSNDLYLHQDRAAAIVRRKKKEEHLGLPPALPTPTSGKTTKVFDADEEEMEDEDETPPMWRTHPPDADREENAKEQFVPAVMDHRSPWILFNDVAELKERLTYKFYRMAFGIPKDADLIDALQIQEFIDNEYAETTYDSKYHGAYDNRLLEPGELSELNTIIYNTPWTEERMEKVFDKLYEGCREHAEEFADLNKEMESRQSNIVGRPSSKMKKLIDEIAKKQDTNWEWFKTFDRRVYLLHIQMAIAVDQDMKNELVERYKFQVEVQRLFKEARSNLANAEAAYRAITTRNPNRITNDFVAEIIADFRAAWKGLKKIIQDAREINLPAMKNFEEGERLADFILDGKMVPEPPLSGLKGVWLDKLMSQLRGVRNRCARLHFKSLGGILAMQEKVATKWLAARRPVTAEVIPAEAAEAVVAEVLPDDVVVAEVIEDVIVAEVIPADEVVEPLPLDEIPVEVIPAAPAVADTSNKTMAAFVTTPQHSLAQAMPTPVTPPVVQPTAKTLETLPL